MFRVNLERQIRLFGLYPLTCSLFQMAVYFHSGVFSGHDPRVAYYLLAMGSEVRLARLEWASAIWLFCVGIGFLAGLGKPLTIIYPISECLLASPTGFYILASFTTGVGELTLTGRWLFQSLALFLVFTLVPILWSIVLAFRWSKSLRKTAE